MRVQDQPPEKQGRRLTSAELYYPRQLAVHARAPEPMPTGCQHVPSIASEVLPGGCRLFRLDWGRA